MPTTEYTDQQWQEIGDTWSNAARYIDGVDTLTRVGSHPLPRVDVAGRKRVVSGTTGKMVKVKTATQLRDGPPTVQPHPKLKWGPTHYAYNHCRAVKIELAKPIKVTQEAAKRVADPYIDQWTDYTLHLEAWRIDGEQGAKPVPPIREPDGTP